MYMYTIWIRHNMMDMTIWQYDLSSNPLGLSDEATVIQRWNNGDSALKQLWFSVVTTVIQRWNNGDLALKQLWFNVETTVIQRWNNGDSGSNQRRFSVESTVIQRRINGYSVSNQRDDASASNQQKCTELVTETCSFTINSINAETVTVRTQDL